MRLILTVFIGFLALTWDFGQARAEDGASPATTVVKSMSKKSKKKLGKSPREKEAEGTEAPNRFEADTVIKSKFQLDGQPLEVDPD